MKTCRDPKKDNFMEAEQLNVTDFIHALPGSSNEDFCNLYYVEEIMKWANISQELQICAEKNKTKKSKKNLLRLHQMLGVVSMNGLRNIPN